MKAGELDELFDSGADITEYLDMSTVTKNGTQTKKSGGKFEWAAGDAGRWLNTITPTYF